MDSIIKVEKMSKHFGSGNKKVEIFDEIDLSVERNQLIGIKGRSGSGKTTLLNLFGSLDQPSSGEIYIKEQLINSLDNKQRSELRRTEMGFVFQSYGLVPLMTVEENIEFGLRIAGIPRNERTEKIKQSIELVGLSKRLQHRPFELSGGEQQRVAIARAIATNPSIILADEPTAELDTKTGISIIQTFHELVKNAQTTIIMTTHEEEILNLIEHVYALEDKKIAYDKN
ncbi:MAG TPA: ABC transporter ATP-binding protein [Virgibacillus sp.]|nr:ABC transporter ATP-binding protein [Virgibacillus sp.]HLR68176.1 ABC transporter ATP-binding protein [Virgibacillus sp.]